MCSDTSISCVVRIQNLNMLSQSAPNLLFIPNHVVAGKYHLKQNTLYHKVIKGAFEF